jgi:4-hydroxythreonine-4-phosphate dehydrogenase
MQSSSFLIITPGDPLGIGPEVTVKALLKHTTQLPVVIIGASESHRGSYLKKLYSKLNPEFISECDLFRIKLKKGRVYFIAAPESTPSTKIKCLAGFQAGWSIVKAVQLLKCFPKAALVTGPVSKENLISGGFPYHGHTKLLEDLANEYFFETSLKNPYVSTMMMANARLRVSLATTHCSFKEVPRRLTSTALTQTILNTHQFLKDNCGIKIPSIAVLSLNPHAGENGLLGKEEKTLIEPCLKKLKKKLSKSVHLTGPWPSDTFFAVEKHLKDHDGVVALYHDQGLIPVKLLDFYHTVNLTLGLPFIRTSVDHGTAFSIARQNKAREDSMIAAIQEAEFLLRHQIKGKG